MHIKRWIVRSLGLVLATVLMFVVGSSVNDMFIGACLFVASIFCLVLLWGQMQYVVYQRQLYRIVARLADQKSDFRVPLGLLGSVSITRHGGESFKLVVEQVDELDKKVFVVTKVSIDTYLQTVSGLSAAVLTNGVLQDEAIITDQVEYAVDLRKEMLQLSESLLQVHRSYLQ